ncbi:MAG: LytTR family transcriptional regulator [Bacteroidetes bacterium]|nr:LytTR family transcriptional regulator [Bacteroidota bacterium]
MLESIASKNILPGKIAIPSSDGLKFVLVADIIHCESDNNYTTLYLNQNRKLVASRTLKEFDEMLQMHSFVRIHQSHLINLQHLDEYIKTDGGSVKMTDGSMLPIARNRKEEFIDRLAKI